jgi:mRNA-degrading endonuclease toxin of MazEF toxin-antitoxin module
MVNNVPMQGDIIKIDLNPKQGHEQKGYRPYICLSHHLVSDYANIAVFAPISNTTRQYPLSCITVNYRFTSPKLGL